MNSAVDKWTKWDLRFLDLAKDLSTWSKDPSTKVGAVITQGKDVVGFGFNGFPRLVHDTEERLNNRELKYKFTVHAEVNAVLMAGKRAYGGTLYVYPTFMLPNICNECCKVAIQAGIREIVCYEPDPNADFSRWADSIKISQQMCDEAGVIYRGVKPR